MTGFNNSNTTLLLVLLGLTPACTIGDKNLGESDSETTDTAELSGDGDGDEGDGDGDEGDGDGDGDPGTCGNGSYESGDELCFEVISLAAPGPLLDVQIVNVDGESSYHDVVALTSNPEAPLAIWHFDDDEHVFLPEPELVLGVEAAPVIAGLELGDFDPGDIEYLDIAYATADGVVIGWNYGTGDDGGFDDFTLIECANPMSFDLGNFDGDNTGGLDVICAHQAGTSIEVLLASNLGQRNFAAPIPVGSDLSALTPVHNFGGGFVAHDRADELIVWEYVGDEYLSTSYPVPALAWDLVPTNFLGGNKLVVASHDPQGLLMINGTPEGEYEVGELIATDALPYHVTPMIIVARRYLLATLDSGHLGIWQADEEGVAELTRLIEVGPEPRRVATGAVGTNEPVVAVTNGDNTVSLLLPNL